MTRLALFALLAAGVAFAQPPKAEKPKAAGGVQWFTTLEAGRAEAAKTGRPILLVSGTPHCGGVSGIW